MLHACLSLSFSKTVLPSWSLTQPVRLMLLPFSEAVASFFSAFWTFLSPWLAGSCAISDSEAANRNANKAVITRFINHFLPSSVLPNGLCLYRFEMLAEAERRAAIALETKGLEQ